MKRGRLVALSALLLSAGFATTAGAFDFYYWTGKGIGWKDQVPPPGDGSAILVFGASVRQDVFLTGNFTVDSLLFLEDDDYRFQSLVGPITYTINNGVDGSLAMFPRADISADFTLNIAQDQVWHMGEGGAATHHGPLTGIGDLTITANGGGALVLANLTGTPSTYSGNLTIAPTASTPAGLAPTLAIWGANSIGTGTITFSNGGSFTTHFAPTLTNNFVFNDGALLAGQSTYSPIRFRMWDAPSTTLAGNVVLANSTTLQANFGWLNKLESQNPNSTGGLPLPGPLTRYPLVISGPISEANGSQSLNIIGPGVVILSGANTYTGGTNVGFATGSAVNANGSLVFGSLAAVPAVGTVTAGIAGGSTTSGYAGVAISAVGTPGTFQNFLDNKVASNSGGAVGLDTLPGESTGTFTETIDLTGFTSAGNGIRLGTATSAIITGNIFPQNNSIYNFGNGGGKLYVQSPLDDIDGPGVPRSVLATSQGVALELYLQGNNTYTGGTTATNGFIIFDGANAFPSTGSLRAAGNANAIGISYIGYTNATGLAPATFLSRFDQLNTWGVLGFDTTNIGSPVSINNLDLTGFNDGVYVGTTTAAILTGTITPTTVPSANAANTLRLTAATGGTLTVASTLADPGSPLAVVVGASAGFQKMSDGTVRFLGNNTYSGGTTINNFGNITVAGETNSAFGTGAITLPANGGLVGLSATVASLNFGNDIVFATPVTGGTPTLSLVGTQDFVLSGDISGPPASSTMGVGQIQLATPNAIEVTLRGDNSGFNGYFSLHSGFLHFDGNTASGQGGLVYISPAGVATFNPSGSFTNPVLYGIDGDFGALVLPNGTNLTINLDNPNSDYDFGGMIAGNTGGAATSASLTLTGTGLGDDDMLYLFGNNTYTGGTTITGQSVLALGNQNAAGTGAITINATDGGLVLNSDVVLTNPINLVAGGLAGLGAFAPSSFNGTPGGPIVIGANNLVIPGIPDDESITGTLIFATNTTFQDGGAMQWLLGDPDDTDAFSLLAISGALDLNSVTPGGFLFQVGTMNADGTRGERSDHIVFGQSYSLLMISAAGGINGFDAGKFDLDISNFQGGDIPEQFFSITSDSFNVYLNFTAVPEPSTWALLVIGGAFLGLTWFRRRRRA